jgi:hypothetical protein
MHLRQTPLTIAIALTHPYASEYACDAPCELVLGVCGLAYVLPNRAGRPEPYSLFEDLTPAQCDQFFHGVYHHVPTNQIITVIDWSGFLARRRRVPRLKAEQRRCESTRPVLLAQHNREGKKRTGDGSASEGASPGIAPVAFKQCWPIQAVDRKDASLIDREAICFARVNIVEYFRAGCGVPGDVDGHVDFVGTGPIAPSLVNGLKAEGFKLEARLHLGARLQ